MLHRRRSTAWWLLAVPGTWLPAQDLVGMQWRVNASGQLETRISTGNGAADDTEGWQVLVPIPDGLANELPSRDRVQLAKLGPIVLTAMLFHGHGGACALAEAERRMSKLGVGYALIPMPSWTPDEVNDLLRVSYLKRSPLASAELALRRMEKRPNNGRFLRAAISEALGEEATEELPRRSPDIAKEIGLAALPDGTTFVVGIDTTRFSDIDPLLAAWREWCRRRGSEADLTTAGSVPFEQLADFQHWMDIPGQLPVEVSLILGNWRADYAMFAGFDKPAGWWLFVGGDFSPDLAKHGLSRIGAVIAEGKPSYVRALLGELAIVVTPGSLEIAIAAASERRRGSDLPRLKALSQNVDAWVHLPSSNAWLRGIGGTEATARLRGGVLTAQVHSDAITKVIESWQQLLARLPTGPTDLVHESEIASIDKVQPGALESAKAVLTVIRLVQSVRTEVQGERDATWSIDLRRLEPLQLAQMLTGWPNDIATFLAELKR